MEGLTKPPAWMDDAACLDTDPELFFVGDIDNTRHEQRPASLSAYFHAAALCARCEVREPCRKYAVATRSEGIWGGMTTRERERRK